MTDAHGPERLLINTSREWKLATQTLFVLTALLTCVSADDILDEVTIVANPAEDYLQICGWEFDTEGGGYSTCSIDLDGDGLEDRLFANAGTSGTGGMSATVYLARPDETFTRAGGIGHGAIAREKIRTGATLLHCSWNFGGGHSAITTYLISHEGIAVVTGVSGQWIDEEYEKLFETVFKNPLKAEYKFVPTRPSQ